MARYLGPREKIERRLGEKLGLKGERSRSPKSATVKRPYPPGVHGQAWKGKVSEYALQLRAKQKVRNIYRLLEKQFKRTVKDALESKQDPYQAITGMLEMRLDNVVFRMGLAQSRDQARQLVNHGHVTVNGRKVTIPSFHVKAGEVIAVREGSKRSVYFSSLMPQWLKGHEAPSWLTLDKDAVTATVQGQPNMEESGVRVDDLQSIIEYYSR